MFLLNNIVAASASGTVAEALYRDANSLNYADNKPSEEAIDRVVNKLNQEYATSFLVGLYLWLIRPFLQLGQERQMVEETYERGRR